MSFENLYLVKCYAGQRVAASLREMETCRMLQEAGIDHKPWIVRRTRRWLVRLGQALVALGQRLERSDTSWRDRTLRA
jgi:hypothetical protein